MNMNQAMDIPHFPALQGVLDYLAENSRRAIRIAAKQRELNGLILGGASVGGIEAPSPQPEGLINRINELIKTIEVSLCEAESNLDTVLAEVPRPPMVMGVDFGASMPINKFHK